MKKVILFFLLTSICLAVGGMQTTFLGPFVKGLFITNNPKLSPIGSSIELQNLVIDKNNNISNIDHYISEDTVSLPDTGDLQGVFISNIGGITYIFKALNGRIYFRTLSSINYRVIYYRDTLSGPFYYTSYIPAKSVSDKIIPLDTALIKYIGSDTTIIHRIMWLTEDYIGIHPDRWSGGTCRRITLYPHLSDTSRINFFVDDDTLIITDGINPAIIWWGDTLDYRFYSILGDFQASTSLSCSLDFDFSKSGIMWNLSNNYLQGLYLLQKGYGYSGNVAMLPISYNDDTLIITDYNANSWTHEGRYYYVVSGISEIIIDSGIIKTTSDSVLYSKTKTFWAGNDQLYYFGAYAYIYSGKGQGKYAKCLHSWSDSSVMIIKGDTLYQDSKFRIIRLTTPIFDNLLSYNNMNIILHKNIIYWSEPLTTSIYYSLSYLIIPNEKKINSIEPLFGNLYAFRDNDIYGVNGPTNGIMTSQLLSNICGCDLYNGTVNINNRIYTLYKNSLYLFDGNSSNIVSNPVKQLLTDIPDSMYHNISLCSNKDKLLLSWSNKTLYYDPNYDYWSTFDFGFTYSINEDSFCFIKDSTDKVYHLINNFLDSTYIISYLKTPYILFKEEDVYKKWWKFYIDYYLSSGDTINAYFYKDFSITSFDTMIFTDTSNIMTNQDFNILANGKNISCKLEIKSKNYFILRDIGYRWSQWGRN